MFTLTEAVAIYTKLGYFLHYRNETFVLTSHELAHNVTIECVGCKVS